MSFSRVVVPSLLLCVGGTVAGCSGDNESEFVPKGSIESSDSSPAGQLAAGETVVRVDTGRWGDAAMMPTLVDYVEARQASMRERRIVPELLEAASFQWVQQQRAVIAGAEERGWTVPAEAQMRVVGVRSSGSDAVVEVCMWGPSVDFIEVKTGRPVDEGVRQWHPFDVKMVLVDDRWYVSAAAEGEFACEVDEG